MQRRHPGLVVFVLICGALALDVAHYLPLVPDPLASHFGFGGRPNGWTSHFRMIAGLAVLVLLFAAIFAAAFFFDRVPDHLISLPHKTYWLAPERREATLLYVSAWLRWFLVLTLAFVKLVVGLTLRANLHSPPQLSVATLAVLILYLVAALTMVVTLIMRLHRPA
jgi:serine/threonine-protein kinase